MKRFYASFVIAFSTYSKLPMPQVAWSEANMRHTLSFFPLVGAVLGLLFYGAARLCALLDFGPSAAAAVLAIWTATATPSTPSPPTPPGRKSCKF